MERITQILNNLDRVLDDNGGFAERPSTIVIKNVNEFINKLPSFYQKILDPDVCITATTHATITIDWYFKKNFLSVEIGNNKIGWFSEMPDGLNPSSDGIDIKDVQILELIKILNKIYNRSETI